MSHKTKIVDKKKTDVGVKIFLEITIDGDECGYPELDGETHEFSFDIDYERYQDNEKVMKDAKVWSKKVVNKRVEEFDPSENPVGKEVKI